MTTPSPASLPKIADVIAQLEEWAPPMYQEAYDNSGLLVGDSKKNVTAVLLALDCTESIVEEAIAKGANLIVVHHPIIFSGLKRLTPSSYIQRVVIAAIKNDIAIYAIHTNADNIYKGVNKKIGEKLGIAHPQILNPKSGLLNKLITFVPGAYLPVVQAALFQAGAGNIGQYDECSFSHSGEGTFKAGAGTQPHVGKRGARHVEPEQRLEVIYHKAIEKRVIAALHQAHPYEEVAFDCIPLSNSWTQLGSGMVGNLESPIKLIAFFDLLKTTFGITCIRHTAPTKETVQRIAWCGGAGSFLLSKATAAKADVYITGDFKYHEFFDADNQIIIADIGHYESEQFTIELLHDVLKEKLPTFAILLTECNTNPVNYY